MPDMFELGFGAMVGTLIFTLIFCVFFIVCNWRIFTKLGIEGWKCLIPVYSTYSMGMACDCLNLAFINIGCFVVCSFAPILVGFIPLLVVLPVLAAIAAAVTSYMLMYKVIVTLSRPAWFIVLAIFVPIVFYPLLAFTD